MAKGIAFKPVLSAGGALSGTNTWTGVNTFDAQVQWSKGADVASATALPILTDGNTYTVTGTTNIATINTTGHVGTIIYTKFAGILDLIDSASLVLITSANITTAVDDWAIWCESASGVFDMVAYTRADGTALVGGGLQGLTETGNNFSIFLGPTAGNGTLTGNDNIVGGTNSGRDLTSGQRNVIWGLNAASNATTLTQSIVLGHNAAGTGVATGSNVIACGTFAGDSLTSGSDLLLMGINSGTLLTTGSNDVFLGPNTGAVYVGGSDNINLGNTLTGSGASVTNEYIIGHDITGAGTETTKIGSNTDSIVNDWGEDATWTHSSDIRGKNVIKGFATLGLSFICDQNVIAYTKKPDCERPIEWGCGTDDTVDTKIYQGLSAQALRASLDKFDIDFFPAWHVEANGMQTIGEAPFVYPLINAVKELSAEVKALKAQRVAI